MKRCRQCFLSSFSSFLELVLLVSLSLLSLSDLAQGFDRFPNITEMAYPADETGRIADLIDAVVRPSDGRFVVVELYFSPLNQTYQSRTLVVDAPNNRSTGLDTLLQWSLSPSTLPPFSRSSVLSHQLKSICFSRSLNLFVAVANQRTLATSVDGFSWAYLDFSEALASNSSSKTQTIAPSSLSCAPSAVLFSSSGSSGLQQLIVSHDGLSWKRFQFAWNPQLPSNVFVQQLTPRWDDVFQIYTVFDEYLPLISPPRTINPSSSIVAAYEPRSRLLRSTNPLLWPDSQDINSHSLLVLDRFTWAVSPASFPSTYRQHFLNSTYLGEDYRGYVALQQQPNQTFSVPQQQIFATRNVTRWQMKKTVNTSTEFVSGKKQSLFANNSLIWMNGCDQPNSLFANGPLPTLYWANEPYVEWTEETLIDSSNQTAASCLNKMAFLADRIAWLGKQGQFFVTSDQLTDSYYQASLSMWTTLPLDTSISPDNGFFSDSRGWVLAVIVGCVIAVVLLIVLIYYCISPAFPLVFDALTGRIRKKEK